MFTNYDLLGVAPEASDAEVKSAFRKLARTTHPDVAKDGGALYLRIQQAYEVLSDPARRAAYDAQVAAASPSTPEEDEGWRYDPDAGRYHQAGQAWPDPDEDLSPDPGYGDGTEHPGPSAAGTGPWGEGGAAEGTRPEPPRYQPQWRRERTFPKGPGGLSVAALVLASVLVGSGYYAFMTGVPRASGWVPQWPWWADAGAYAALSLVPVGLLMFRGRLRLGDQVLLELGLFFPLVFTPQTILTDARDETILVATLWLVWLVWLAVPLLAVWLWARGQWRDPVTWGRESGPQAATRAWTALRYRTRRRSRSGAVSPDR